MQLSETTLYKNHGAKIGYWTATALATADGAEVRLTYAKTMDGKPVTKVDPIVGKNIGRANETTPQQQAVLELESRVNKQLDKGYVRTLAEASAPATNTLGLKKPMLAHPIDKVKPESIDWSNAWAQTKLDGHRALFKDGVLYSRSGKAINLPHILAGIKASGLDHLHLDGEIYVHGEMLQDIGSLIKKPREESLVLQYHVYDVVGSAPYSGRMAALDKAFIYSDQHQIRLVCSCVVHDRDQLTTFHEAALADGYEGSILRHGSSGYESDKRSSSLLKVKGFEDFEFEVIGFEQGTPNGEFRVPVWVLLNPFGRTEKTKTFKATAAGNMQAKHEQWVMRDSYVGRQLTVQHFGFSKDGGVLLPVALRWREDI